MAPGPRALALGGRPRGARLRDRAVQAGAELRAHPRLDRAVHPGCAVGLRALTGSPITGSCVRLGRALRGRDPDHPALRASSPRARSDSVRPRVRGRPLSGDPVRVGARRSGCGNRDRAPDQGRPDRRLGSLGRQDAGSGRDVPGELARHRGPLRRSGEGAVRLRGLADARARACWTHRARTPATLACGAPRSRRPRAVVARPGHTPADVCTPVATRPAAPVSPRAGATHPDRRPRPRRARRAGRGVDRAPGSPREARDRRSSS